LAAIYRRDAPAVAAKFIETFLQLMPDAEKF